MADQSIIERVENEADVLNRHLEILVLVRQAEPIGIVELSNRTGLQHHKVRYTLHVLEEKQLIKPCSAGATATDRAQQFLNSVNDELEAVIATMSEMKFSEINGVQSI